MKKIIYLILFFLLISNISIAKDLFETEFSNVKFQSINIENSKNKQITDIKLNNFNKIMKNLLEVKNYKKLQKKIDNNFVDKFILNIIINNEIIINDNYSAEIKINFNKDLILNYLISNEIDYIDHIPDNYLTIIYFKNNIVEKTLSKENPFYSYLIQNSDKFNNFYLLPNLDINDRFLINKKDILNGNLKNINKVKKKYNTSNIVLISVINKSEFTNIKIYTINNNLFNLIDNINIKNINYDDFFFNTISKIIENWKSYNLISTSEISSLVCIVKAFNILELKNIKKLIKSSPVIKDIIIKDISFNSNVYTIYYYGRTDILIKSLNRKKINILINEDFCNISLK